jgi:hypothetical protein
VQLISGGLDTRISTKLIFDRRARFSSMLCSYPAVNIKGVQLDIEILGPAGGLSLKWLVKDDVSQ